MAPEVFSHQTGFQSDVWSAGAILYEMTYGYPPYFFLFDRELKAVAISTMIPIYLPPLNNILLLDCIRQCLQFDFYSRPTANYLQRHPYTRS